MEYLDFELEVAAGEGGSYVASVLRSPAGEARAPMQFPYDTLELRNKILTLQIALLRSGGTRRGPSEEDRSVEQFGRDLFASLFTGEVGSRLDVTRSLAQQQGRGVRLKLRIAAPELLGLPWEYLYDTEIGDYVALSVNTPLVRYVPLPQQVEPLQVEPPIRVLGMTAGPKDLEPLDADRERERLQTALADLVDRGVVQLDWVAGETWEHLQEALWGGPWHVFHFVGHGGFNERLGQGVLYLSDAEGKARELPAGDLARLLGDHDPLRLAVLNSCDTAEGTATDVFSSTAAALVRRGTPAVVAMQFQITDAAAIQFSRVFYRAMARGLPVDGAVAEARKSIALQVTNSLEWGTPVLFMRTPDGFLFQLPASTVEVATKIAEVGTKAVTPSPTATGQSFAIEPSSTELVLDATRQARVTCTVRNLTGKRLRARATAWPMESSDAGWFTVEGERERVFEVGASEDFVVSVAVHREVQPGSYAFRLDVASVTDPDEEWSSGTPIAFSVTAPPIHDRKPFPWRRTAIAGGGIAALAAGAVIAILLFGGDPPDGGVSCSGPREANRFDQLTVRQPTYQPTVDMCVMSLTLSIQAAASGVAELTVNDQAVYRIDFSEFDSIGEPGAGSGEREVTLEPAIGVAADQVVRMDLSSCSECESLVVGFRADAEDPP